jgi:2-(1,2-epoxy-1,2-dihydrophenyl)acetyl-CoA isomerase
VQTKTAQSAVVLEIGDGIAHLTLNRPEAGNTITAELAMELSSATQRIEADGSVRAVLLRGAGDTFSAGGDLKTFAAKGADLPSYLRETTFQLHAAISRLARMDAPVIAAVHGSAAGGGFSLACSCDYVIAAESARFVMAYSKIGLAPDGSCTYFLPRLIGPRKTMELTLFNKPLSAREALLWGIVSEVVEDSKVFGRADEVIKTLAAGPTLAIGATKRLLHTTWTETLETQMELESRAISEASGTEDGREGIAAFLEKRKPRFQGK